MVMCEVSLCTSNNNKQLKRNDGTGQKVQFFRFPKNNKMARLWKAKCKRVDNFNIENARMCDKHFVPDDYYINLKHRLLEYSPISHRKLKDDAVPGINLLKEECYVNVPSSSRQLRMDIRQRKTIVNELL